MDQDTPADPSAPTRPSDLARALRRLWPHVAALSLFVMVSWAFHCNMSDPQLLYTGDIRSEYLPRMAHAYRCPWDGFLNRPSPEYYHGTANPGLQGAISFPTTLPFIPALLGKIAPASVNGLMLFEWRITGLFLFLAMLGIYGFLRMLGVNIYIAVAAAVAFPFTGPVWSEYRHVAPMRGRLLCPLVLWGLFVAIRKNTIWTWLLAALAITFALGQSFQLFWVGIWVAVWGPVGLWLHWRHRPKPWSVGSTVRLLWPMGVSMALVAAFFIPHLVRMAAATADSGWFLDFNHPRAFLDYAYRRDFLFNDISLTGLLAPFDPGSGIGPFALLAPLLVVVSVVGRVMLKRSPSPRDDVNAWLFPLGLSLFVVSTVALILVHVPWEWLFEIRDGKLWFRFFGGEVPLRLKDFIRVPKRSWFMLYLLANIALFVPLCVRLAGSGNDRRRWIDGIMLLVLYGVGAVLLSGVSEAGVSGARLVINLALVAACLLALYGCGLPHPQYRHISGVLLVIFALGGAWYARSEIYKETIRFKKEQNPLDLSEALALRDQVISRLPAKVKNQYEYRLDISRSIYDRLVNLCHQTGSACTTSYPFKFLPHWVRRWEQKYYPPSQYVHEFLGVRHRIAAGSVAQLPENSIELAKYADPRSRQSRTMYYQELPNAFPKGWLLQQWEVVENEHIAHQRFAALLQQQMLRTKGIVWAKDGVADRLPRSSSANGNLGDAPPTIKTQTVLPGRLVFEINTMQPTILATNEFYSPRWRITIGDQPVTPLRINVAFMGAVVPQGRHRVALLQ